MQKRNIKVKKHIEFSDEVTHGREVTVEKGVTYIPFIKEPHIWTISISGRCDRSKPSDAIYELENFDKYVENATVKRPGIKSSIEASLEKDWTAMCAKSHADLPDNVGETIIYEGSKEALTFFEKIKNFFTRR